MPKGDRAICRERKNTARLPHTAAGSYIFMTTLISTVFWGVLSEHLHWHITVHCRHSPSPAPRWFPFLNGCNRGLQYYGVIRCYVLFPANNQTISDSESPGMPTVASGWQLPSWAEMGRDGTEHCIGFMFSAALQKSALIDLRHSASVWLCQLFIFHLSAWRLVCLNRECTFSLQSEPLNWSKIWRIDVFVYSIGATWVISCQHWMNGKQPVNNLTSLCV